jgi:uncharacterized protein DUF4266
MFSKAVRPAPMALGRSLVVVVLLSAIEAGCGHVPVYDRAQLAHPTMSTSDPTRAAEEHVRAVQEGAFGGGFTSGGGCGCN